jgi:D-alanyl-D-alanine dipeptidase
MVKRLLLMTAVLVTSCGTRPVVPQPMTEGMRPILERAAARDLVDVREVIPDIVVDLRYSHPGALGGKAVYPREMPCLLLRQTAERLKLAQEALKRQGYQLCVWDAWRPAEVQLRFLEESENPHLFRHPDEGWSGHCGGCAVDVTLLDREGRHCEMPTWHDEASEHTGYHYRGGSRKVGWNLHRLQTAMHGAGFRILESEWWHFDDTNLTTHAVPVVTAEALGVRVGE